VTVRYPLARQDEREQDGVVAVLEDAAGQIGCQSSEPPARRTPLRSKLRRALLFHHHLRRQFTVLSRGAGSRRYYDSRTPFDHEHFSKMHIIRDMPDQGRRRRRTAASAGGGEDGRLLTRVTGAEIGVGPPASWGAWGSSGAPGYAAFVDSGGRRHRLSTDAMSRFLVRTGPVCVLARLACERGGGGDPLTQPRRSSKGWCSGTEGLEGPSEGKVLIDATSPALLPTPPCAT